MTKTVVFCENVDHAIEVAEQFSDRGWDADYVEGDMPMRERDRIIKRFVSGRLQILTNCQILTEGFDLPHPQAATELVDTRTCRKARGRMMDNKIFYVIMQDGQTGGESYYSEYETAEAEAVARARRHPDKLFYIVAAVARIKLCDVEVTMLEVDEIPF